MYLHAKTLHNRLCVRHDNQETSASQLREEIFGPNIVHAEAQRKKSQLVAIMRAMRKAHGSTSSTKATTPFTEFAAVHATTMVPLQLVDNGSADALARWFTAVRPPSR